MLRRGFSFPSTVENVLCMSEHDAYAVERGPNGQIMRKEVIRSSVSGGNITLIQVL